MQFSTLFSVALSFAAVVFAQSGNNPVTYPLGGTIDSSVPLTIQWTPTTSGTVTIRLLKGPPTNILDTDTVAASIPNTGSFTWEMPKSLQDSGTMPQGDRYGFKVIDDLTNTFEYSPPFDISVTDSTFVVPGSNSQSSAIPESTATPEPTQVATTSTEPTTTAESTPIASSEPTEVPAATETFQENVPVQTTLSTQTTTATASQSTGTKDSNNDNSKIEVNPGPNVTLIIGIAVGVVCGIAVAIFAIIMVCRRKNIRKRQSTSAVQNLMADKPRPASMALVYGDGMYNKV